MSMPVGQSRAHPLQDRQRSRAWCTAGRLPAQLDQVAVDHLLQHPGPAAGRVLLVPGGQVRRAHHAETAGVVGQALADAGAAVHRRRRSGRPGRPARRPADRRPPAAGRPARPGLSRFSGSKHALTCAEQVDARRGSTWPAAAPNGPARRRARPTSSRRSRPPARRPARRRSDRLAAPPRTVSGKSIRHVHAAVAEVPVRQPVQTVLGQQRVEVPQVGARAAPAAPRRPPSPGRPGRPG